jgi:hypothetical protein
MLSSTSSTANSSHAEEIKKKGEKILAFDCTNQLVNGEEHSQCVLVKFSQTVVYVQEILSFANKPSQFLKEKQFEMHLMRTAVTVMTETLLDSFEILYLKPKIRNFIPLERHYVPGSHENM